MTETVVLLLTGDVMTGRGIDQILQHPGDPTLYEAWAKSALRYVELAEERSGPIPRGVAPEYVWGECLEVFRDVSVTARVVNLETAVTDRGSPWPDKGIHYRMHPANLPCLSAARVDVATSANNHAMDWSEPGLLHTIEVVEAAGIRVAGAGRDEREAWRPIRVGPVVVVGVGATSSGIPPEWRAGPGRPGVALLPDLSDRTVDQIGEIVAEHAAEGDVVVVSIHWGGNWGYRIPEAHRRFARALVDRAGVHLVHGHSSHHPLGIEVYHGRLVLYGCGDLVTDYEGIGGHPSYRGDLGAIYLAGLEPATGALAELTLAPTRMRGFRLTSPSEEEVAWLAAVLDRESRPSGVRLRVGDDGRLHGEW